MSPKTIMAGMVLAFALAGPAAAQDADHGAMDHGSMDHGAMDKTMEPKGDNGPSSKAFAAANSKMHKGMDITFSGNADLDFVRGMIAHHQGAIDMAKVELEHGKDAELRKLAEEIIAAQEAEIGMMEDWLAKNGG
ncbi:DUF305 domain-containing protein [Rhizobium sp. Root482]|uniref:CopM family metallochaperone n=1 Tax=Rhizobium sp. Root482 TaxID=1736543 RepID=UPI0006FCFEAB|nr:DUF305 domain-containing protein [Rhizobium sp. Root482]KQY19992.1 hypothetical protein ASD31_06310 [Rhizobium sp. Root482]